MKVVFVSNYLNHHQLPICLEFFKQTNGHFYFVANSTVSEERLKLGYRDMNRKYPWIIRTYDSEKQIDLAKKVINDADVVIIGSAPDYLIKNRLKHDKLTFRYSERIYKKKPVWYKTIIRKIQHYFRHIRHKNLYMLCSSSFTAGDYAKTGAFINKCFKWGYFPEVKKYKEIQTLIGEKKENSIVWVGRFLDFKHPEHVVNLAERLKKDGVSFQVKMIGTGILQSEIDQLIKQKGLCNYIEITGAMSPEKVREEMEMAQIHLFTSDRKEGWGAVLNEAMNSACISVCSDAIGAANFLIKDGENGYTYVDGDEEALYSMVKKLLCGTVDREIIAKKAYQTMAGEWCAENAVKKLLILAETFLKTGYIDHVFEYGVCSKAI